ncbi:MAG: substrate-binding periplasmic protein [Vogesella sp.]|uniref:substrate-binding periplasmic protein n=1 Tax=Vogesella sp. TaxID=1904252 RepID=UPI003919C960
MTKPLLALLLCCPALSQAASVLAVTTEFPPFQSASPQPLGLALDTARELARRNGDTLDVQFLPWARAYQTAETTPGVLIFCLARTAEREPRYQWLGQIASGDVTVWQLAARRDLNARTLEQARRWQLGATVGDMKMQYLLQQGFVIGQNLQESGDDLSNIRKLFAGRIDLLPFSHRQVLQYRSAQAGLDFAALKPAFSLPALAQPLYLAFSPGSDSALVRRYQASFRQLQRSGWLARQQRHYQQLPTGTANLPSIQPQQNDNKLTIPANPPAAPAARSQ